MTFHLLLDLDDTLLDTNLDAFLPAYFKKLAGFMSNRVPPEKFVPALMHSTQVMYESSLPDRTLEQVFSDHFYPALGIEQADLAYALNQFYDEVFPTLGSLTKQRPEAIRFVEWALAQGWKVSIATDPLFPRKAILHRLRWAGLAPEQFPFTLISDFHHFHFAKKAVTFYPEFLGHLGWQDEPALMVGDSLERDIHPSRKAGLQVFWLKNNGASTGEEIPQGSFANLKAFLEKTELESMKVNDRTPAALLQFLQVTPALLHSMMLTHDSAVLSRQPSPDEWSFLEVLCHLRDVDGEVNIPRVEAIMREKNSFIPGQSTDGWAKERGYASQNLVEAFNLFIANRARLVQTLSLISSADWERRARHSFLGPTSLQEIVGFMVDHDRLHIRQAIEALQ